MECLQITHTHLRQARLESKLDLEALSARTFLSPAILRKIDEGRFEQLPAGLYARSYVKTFAAEVGLDPEEALRQIEHLLPGAPDPLPVLRELKGPSPSDRLMAFVGRLRERAAPAEGVAGAAEEIERVEPSKLRAWGAAALDATVLLAIDAGLILLIALGTGLPAEALLKQATVSLAALCAVPTVLYFVLFKGIGGCTPGAWLCRVPDRGPHAPLTLDVILRRTVLG